MYTVSRTKTFFISMCGFIMGGLIGDDNIPWLVIGAIVFSVLMVTSADEL